MQIKRIISAILCVILAVTAMPLSAFATDNVDYRCKIEFKKGCKESLTPGESTEVYVDYYVGDNKDLNIVWSAPGNMCEYEYVTDSETGLITGMKITCVSGGMFYAFVRIVDAEGNKLAEDNIEIWCEAQDNKPFDEKIKEFTDMLPAKLGLLGYCLAYVISVVTFGPVTGIMETCISLYVKITELINGKG